MNPFQSLREYEVFIYTLPQQFPVVRSSTLIISQRGRFTAELRGELVLADNLRLSVYERLSWGDDGAPGIVGYSYEVWRGNEKLYWYDSQPHPNDLSLASTHPHHKHVPPNMRHNRIPAPGISFVPPNLPFLIREIETIKQSSDEG